MLNKIKIGPKLIGGFVIVSLISVVIGVIGYVSLKEVGNVRLPSIIGLQRIFRTMNDLRVSERTLLIPDLSAEYKQLMTDRMSESWKTLEDGWKIYEPLPQTKEEAVIWKQFVPAFNDWKTKHETVIQLAQAGKLDEAKALSIGDGSQALLKVEEHLKSLITLNDKVADAYVKRANSIVLISVILGFIIAVVLGIALTLSITKPITNMVEVSNNIANGDIEQRIEHKSADEIGLLANSFRQMVDYVRGVADSVISISKGDVSIDIKPKSDKDVLSKSVVQVTTTLKDLISETNTLSKAAIAGKLDTRGNAQKFQGGYQDIVQGFNDTLDAVIGPLNVAAEYVDRISKGDIPPKITESYNGDFNEIKNNINVLIETLNSFTGEMNNLYKEQNAGNIDFYIEESKFDGVYKQMANGVNEAVKIHVNNILKILDIIKSYANGDFEPILEKLPGKQVIANERIDLIRNNLLDLIKETGILVESAIAGKLDTRADASKFMGDYVKIIDGINKTLDAVIGPLNVAAEYVDRISKGDIPPKITESYNGDFNEIKNNLNQCIDTLNMLISEMKHMSDEHNAGDIDVAIDSGKFQGAYSTIAQGVNDMVAGHITVNKKAMACVGEFGKGNFEAPLDKFPGKKAFINDTIEQVRANLKALIADANMLSKAAVEGKLDTRADATKHQGDFRKIVEGVNDTLDAVIAPINESSKVLAECAEGDLTVRMTGDYKGQLAELKNSINTTIESLETTLSQVNSSVGQVSSASEQIASGSQSLAESASEQASSLEEISSSLEELSSMAKQNADNSSQAKNLSQEASNSAKAGNEAMDMMNQAITKIKGSSDETAKIIKTIDEIAFQTNLLALNAAVEAARAGEAGKGFAVVAEEVRNLAQRSASAAKNTSDLIQQATENADDGVRISGEVAKTFAEIAQSINKVNDLIAEISAASIEQSQGIGQINTAVADMDKLTQSNAANSEQSASAAQELSAQVSELRSMIGRFRMNGNGHSKSENSVKNVMSMISKKADTKEKKKPANTMNLSSGKGKDFFPLDDTELAEF